MKKYTNNMKLQKKITFVLGRRNNFRFRLRANHLNPIKEWDDSKNRLQFSLRLFYFKFIFILIYQLKSWHLTKIFICSKDLTSIFILPACESTLYSLWTAQLKAGISNCLKRKTSTKCQFTSLGFLTFYGLIAINSHYLASILLSLKHKYFVLIFKYLNIIPLFVIVVNESYSKQLNPSFSNAEF